MIEGYTGVICFASFPH